MSTTVQINENGMTPDMASETTQLENDINQLYADEATVGNNKTILDAQCAQMGAEESSDFFDWTIVFNALVTMGDGCLAGSMVCLMDVMNIINDLTNIMTTGQNSYDNIVNYDSSGTTDPTANTDIETFDESINLFLTTPITVTTVDPTTKATSTQTVDGVLNLLSNGPTSTGATGDYWPGGYAPMSTQTADLIATSLTATQGYFGTSWTSTSMDYTAQLADVQTWSTPQTYSGSTMQYLPEENNEINSNFGTVGTQLQSALNTLQTQLQQLMSMYSQYNSLISTTEQSIESEEAYMVQKAGI